MSLTSILVILALTVIVGLVIVARTAKKLKPVEIRQEPQLKTKAQPKRISKKKVTKKK